MARIEASRRVDLEDAKTDGEMGLARLVESHLKNTAPNAIALVRGQHEELFKLNVRRESVDPDNANGRRAEFDHL